MKIATENIYGEDDQGIRRLLVAQGQEIPEGVDVPSGSAADAADLPIADYDTLDEAVIVEKLGDLGEEELVQVREYEQAHQARGAITTFGVESKPVTAARKRSPRSRKAADSE